jgi:hypothetical protein
MERSMVRRILVLSLLVLGLAGCASLSALVPGQAAKARANAELTIIYTGYGRGNVDPAEDCG